VQVRYRGAARRITLGAVGTLAFEGPPDHPGALDLARAALNAARRSEDHKRAIGRTRNPRGVTLGELWKAYGDAGWPMLHAVGVKRESSVATDTHRWNKHFTASPTRRRRTSMCRARSVGSIASRAWAREATRLSC
jgi:hypothetical protein